MADAFENLRALGIPAPVDAVNQRVMPQNRLPHQHSLSAAPPSLRANVQDYLAKSLFGDDYGRSGYRSAGRMVDAAGATFAAPVEAGLLAYDAGVDYAAGNPGAAAGGMAMAALGIPGSAAGRAAFGAATDAITPRSISAELRRQQREVLNERDLERLARANPAFRRAASFMLPGELKAVLNNSEGVEKVSRLLDVLPQAKNFAATAKFGEPKKGWYRASTQALIDVFGPQDARRFATLLSATSPQTSVEMNLQNALNIWRNWTAEGRPTDPRAIKAIMGRSVAGNKGEDSVLDAWVNNSVRALSAADPSRVTLSGPKVDSFYRNLVGDVMRVTNDAHMANFSGISQDILRVSPTANQLEAGNPGYSPAYAAMSSRVREGGAMAGYTPAETQETVWSVAMPLNEMQATTGLPSRELLQRGMLTPEVINAVPDFSTLLKQPGYRDILEQAGYGDAVNRMPSFAFPKVNPSLSLAEQRELEAAARRLEDLRGLRGRESRARSVPVRDMPETAFVYQTEEAVPGEGIGHLPGLLEMTFPQRQNYTGAARSAFTNEQGIDTLHAAMGMNPISTRATRGLFTEPSGRTSTNPGFAAGVEVPLTKSVGIPVRDEQKLRTAAAIRGTLLAQHGSPYSGLVPKPRGRDALVPLPKKASEEGLLAVSDQYPAVAAADVGEGVNILNFGDDALSKSDIDNIGGLLGMDAKSEAVRARNVTNPNMNYYDIQDEWLRPPGSAAVTKRMMSEVEKLPAKTRRAIEAPFKDAADRLHKLYSTRAKNGEQVREDLMNLLDIARKGGFDAIEKAVGKGAFVPALAAIGLVPTVSALSSSEAETPGA